MTLLEITKSIIYSLLMHKQWRTEHAKRKALRELAEKVYAHNESVSGEAIKYSYERDLMETNRSTNITLSPLFQIKNSF